MEHKGDISKDNVALVHSNSYPANNDVDSSGPSREDARQPSWPFTHGDGFPHTYILILKDLRELHDAKYNFEW